MIIESLSNERVKNWTKLKIKKYRDEMNLYIIENEHLIFEALKKGFVKEIIILQGEDNIFDFDNVFYVSENIINKISSNVSKVSYLAICFKKEEVFNFCDRILILDKIQDPGNLGTLLRSAVSFGFNQVICSKDCVDFYNDKSIRSTQGAMFYLNYIKADLIDIIKKLKNNNYKVVSLTLENSIFLKDLKTYDKMAFIIGNEGNGIRKELQDLSDTKVKIEMNDFESLNAGVAGSIAMYMFMK